MHMEGEKGSIDIGEARNNTNEPSVRTAFFWLFLAAFLISAFTCISSRLISASRKREDD